MTLVLGIEIVRVTVFVSGLVIFFASATMLALDASISVVALSKKMTKPETKTVTRTVAVPKTKIVKQQTPPQTTPKDTEPTDFTHIRPQAPLPNQQNQ